jgi:hypothetical protein
VRRTKDRLATKKREKSESQVKGKSSPDMLDKFDYAGDTGCADVMQGAKLKWDSIKADRDHWEHCMETIRQTMIDRQTFSEDVRYGKTIAPEVSQMVSLSELGAREQMLEAVKQLKILSVSLRKTKQPPKNFVWSYPLQQLIHGLFRKEEHVIANANVRRTPKAFDSQFVRHEKRMPGQLTVTWYEMNERVNGKIRTTPKTTTYYTANSMWVATRPVARLVRKCPASSSAL